MIVMLNGSFGAGKTTVARELLTLLPGAMLFDPEIVGVVVRMLTEGAREGAEETDDFQDIALWRSLTIETARQLRARYGRPLIVPMTLANRAYFDEIRAGFAALTPALHHVCLVAPLATIQARLAARGDEPDAWSQRKAARCVPLLADPSFQTHIDTDGVPPALVAARIAALVRAGTP